MSFFKKLKDRMFRSSDKIGEGLEALVADNPEIFEFVRGEGLILGLKCRLAPAEVVKAGYAERVIVIPAADNVVRLLPPVRKARGAAVVRARRRCTARRAPASSGEQIASS